MKSYENTLKVSPNNSTCISKPGSAAAAAQSMH